VLLETVAAIQILVVITIMPVVVRSLGGLHLYGLGLSAATVATVAALPIAGRLADRMGARRPLAGFLAVFAVGTVIAAIAPTMPLFVVGRLIQGFGAGAQFAVSLAAVARSYPEAQRARVLALISLAWVVPGLIGPSFGAVVASTVGWRWAFVAVLPILVVAAAMVLPAISADPPTRADHAPLEIFPPVLLAVATGGLLAALTGVHWWTAPMAVVSLAVVVMALRRILPPGSVRASPGLPAATAAAFLLSFAYFAADGFLPLLLTRVRGTTVTEASVVVTTSTVAWSLGSWWQSRMASTWSRPRLLRLGGVGIVAGVAGVGLGLLDVPVAIPYVAWTVGGLGMGVAYPTVTLVAMEDAEEGREASALASTQLTEALGVALGPGIAGSAVALAAAVDGSLRAGLSGALAAAVLASILLVALAGRVASGRGSVRRS
jgi:MFS family permease